MTQSPVAGSIVPGTVLADKFRVEQVLGQGGMGVVVAAHHLQLDERVALKFLLPEALSDAEAVARFAREARAAVKIKSEHVARVTDVGTMTNGSPYMVMEYLQGNDLSALVRARGALGVEDAVEYVLQACEAVAEAHALGIVHRDLKPANLFLTQRADNSACIKVLDFGISKVTTGRDSEMRMTRTATVMGSPLYMSPEQMASSRDVDTRTDIWAIGAILHELLTGEVPFLADTMPQLCAKILQEEAPPLRDRRPDAPEALGAVIRRCLEKDPTRRYPSVAELATDLWPFAPVRGRVSVERITKVIAAAGLSDSNLSLGHSNARTAAVGTTQQAWGASQAKSAGGARWLLAGVAALVVVGGAAVWLLGVFQPKPQDASVAGGVPSATQQRPQPEPPKPVADKQPAPAVAPLASEEVAAAEAAAAESQSPVKTRPSAPVRPRPSKTSAPRPSESSPKEPPKSAVPAVDLYQDRK